MINLIFRCPIGNEFREELTPLTNTGLLLSFDALSKKYNDFSRFEIIQIYSDNFENKDIMDLFNIFKIT